MSVQHWLQKATEYFMAGQNRFFFHIHMDNYHNKCEIFISFKFKARFLLQSESSRNQTVNFPCQNKYLKGGVCIFQKRFRKLSRAESTKEACSQSAVRGVSTHDGEERALSAHDGH